LDSTFIPAKGSKKVGLTQRGKRSKVMLVTDDQGIPIGAPVESVRKNKV
jgi:hypothetical protein